MRKNLIKAIALTSAMCMALPMFASCKKKDENVKEEAKAYVAVDINPSLSLTLDKDNKVISVHAENEDAQIMIYGENLKGLNVDVALGEIAKLSLDLGYVNEENHGVSLNVSGNVNGNELTGKLQTAYNEATGNFGVSVDAEGTFTDLRELESFKAQYSSNADVQNLTMADFRLIVDAQSVDGTLSFEKAASMSKEELMQIIADGVTKIEPYATKAYNMAVAAAERAYNEVKGSLLDTLWTVPYTKDLANILTGNRKYKVNNGVIYNMYTNSSRALGVTIDVMEKAKESAENTVVPGAVIDKVALALNLTEEEKTAFVNEITKDGKVTVASLEKYLNRWFKNMTKEERESAKQAIDQAISEVTNFVKEVDAQIADEYKAALNRLVKDLTALIPEDVKNIAGEYFNEFNSLVTALTNAVKGNETLVAVKNVKAVFDSKAEDIMAKMRAELTEQDLKSVENAISLVNDKLAIGENAYKKAKAQAEKEAKEYLENMKNSRKTA